MLQPNLRSTSKSVKPYTPHPTPCPHDKLFQQTLPIWGPLW
ncbi:MULTISPECIES: hypothetical protein [unclassified Microcystis]|nr:MULTISPECIES: hypothetical protein [unclassified Microcystis]